MEDIPRLLSGRPVLQPLTERQEEVLGWLIDYSEEHGYFPVLREVSTHFDRSLSRIQSLVTQLEKKGYLTRTADRSRNIQLTELTRVWYERRQQHLREAQGKLFDEPPET